MEWLNHDIRVRYEIKVEEANSLNKKLNLLVICKIFFGFNKNNIVLFDEKKRN